MAGPKQVDHVLLAAGYPALSSSVPAWGRDLDSFAGSPHQGWGTANRIVPLGDAYLEARERASSTTVSVTVDAPARALVVG